MGILWLFFAFGFIGLLGFCSYYYQNWLVPLSFALYIVCFCGLACACLDFVVWGEFLIAV